MIARHEILRTVFHRQAGLKLPFQVIRETSDPGWVTVDISDLTKTEQRTKLDDLCRQEQQRPVNLEQGPALHIVVAKLGADNHAMLISLPALCSDSQTLRNVVAEIGRYASSKSPEPSSDIMQYADMVEWQNDLLQSDDTKAGRDFWRDYCRQIDPAWLTSISLPLEANLDPVAFTPRVVTTVVDPGLVSRLASLCAERGVSTADFFLTCWYVLLWRLLGQQPNITIGCAFDGRKYAELENACGLFSTYLPLHSQIEANLPLGSLLNGVKESVSEAHKWQESFAWNQIEAFTNRDVMLPFLFEYEDRAGSERYGELTISLLRQNVCSDRFKLKLSCWREDSRLGLEFHYDAARLDAAIVERYATQFQTLLAAAVKDPDTAVSRLPLLNHAEQQQLLGEWNQTAAEFPERRCWHELFEAQAARTPTRPAVRFGDQQLSYGELNERANQLAHYLRRMGVGPDGLVGLCVERSAEMLVAVLGILKAGGAYVPLNADNPKPRLAQQLAGAAALITEQKLLAQMPEIAGKTVCLDSDPAPWADEPKSNPTVNTTLENLVYVIYTSGSTGVPKGVAVRHRNLVNYSWFIGQRLQLEKDAEGLQFATVSTISADLGNTCIYPALIFGGCLHVISYEVATDSLRFARYLEQHPVDVLKIVPSHLSALISSVEGKQILPRRYLILGGEKLSWELVEKIHGLGGSCQIVNHYGPTETTVGSLTLKLNEYEPKKKTKSHSVPLGRPIANTQVYILDQHLQPVPVGVVGELYISGAGVTAGYLNQPERTAERFLANPFVEDSQSKMYRTGDLARYLPAGEIEFLGRGDDQVKIRGFRIELGEIESVLSQHPAIKQAVVLVQEDERGDKRLVAYVVCSREKTTSPEELRAYLEQQLPDYMIPAALVSLAKLPLTANGKIDRQALPAPDEVQSQQKPYLAPRTAMEEIVANIWAEVLHRQPISTDDNFFHLGGHSLLATQVISRLRQQLKIELPLRTLFEKPTVSELAETIDAAKDSNTESAESAIVPVSREVYRAGRS